jgi:hypothetical protein
MNQQQMAVTRLNSIREEVGAAKAKIRGECTGWELEDNLETIERLSNEAEELVWELIDPFDSRLHF